MRGRPLTYVFETTAPGETLFEVDRDGDGTVDAAWTSFSPFTLQTRYAREGVYQFHVTATDPTSGVATTHTFPIVIRAADVVDGVLVVGGTPRADRIEFRSRSRGRVIEVRVNGQRLGRFDADALTALAAFGESGSDNISVRGLGHLPVELDGGPGNDVIRGGTGPTVVRGGPGHDRILTGNSDDVVIDHHGRNRIHSGGGDDEIETGPGDDWINSGSGDDNIHSGPGDDTVFAGVGDDIVAAADGADLVFGWRGRDVLIGGDGRDTLFAGPGEDLLISGWTAFDERPAARGLIRDEWASGRLFDHRVSNLLTGSGPLLGPDAIALRQGLTLFRRQ